MNSTLASWYVYELVDPRTNVVFYVGKGKGDRLNSHQKNALKGKRSRKFDKIREIVSSGFSSIARKVALFWDEQAAYDHETDRIEDYGLENLTNVMPGGQKAWQARKQEKSQRIEKENKTSEKKSFRNCLRTYLITNGFRENPVAYAGARVIPIPRAYNEIMKEQFIFFLNKKRQWAIETALELGYSLKISGKNLCITSV